MNQCRRPTLLFTFVILFGLLQLMTANLAISSESSPRDRILLDTPWQFALGHATDPDKDFGHGKGYFSYLAKTGYGDGAASPDFDDRGWRTVQLPHDWAVEMPFDPSASHSHGYKALGPGFPATSVGWYRHHLFIPQSDLGRRISLEFEGIQRDARVFINGFFLGEENQGNLGQHYDVTAYLNYGGDNVIAVRADVSLEAGWYYEGAGINRHVWLHKTAPLHVAHEGTFVTTEVHADSATISIQTEIENQHENDVTQVVAPVIVTREQLILDQDGRVVARSAPKEMVLNSGEQQTVSDVVTLNEPRLWSPESPNLYFVQTNLTDTYGKLVDQYHTRFGVRTIHFDANTGFFLNGQSVKLKGSNNHEDHAGVGTATPDSLIRYRLERLKSMGMNAYRASHAPASPALLRIADEMGMLVIDENRIAGINQYHLSAVERMIKRARNHPSIIMWSLGNEEWAIEGNIKGARIAKTMQQFTRQLDPTRLITFAISGGWGGVSTTIAAMGVNYIQHGDTDQQHTDYPWQIILGTEETTTQQTRGIYIENKQLGHLPPQENGSSGGNAESGWQHYAERDYLAGIFYWTGFDYRGEPTPYAYPAVASQFGILDSCGFAKDGYYYLKSWWTDEPVLHIFPHWNWPERQGENIEVRVHSNADAVELWLNGLSMGKQDMPPNGHLSWQVPYQPGELKAIAWRDGKEAESSQIATTGPAQQLILETNKTVLLADGQDVAVVNINIQDAMGRSVPDAMNLVKLSLTGPGKIIGVGNGNPSSHEDDVQFATVSTLPLGQWEAPNPAQDKKDIEFNAYFDAPDNADGETVKLLLNALGRSQTAWLNGELLYQNATPQDAAISVQNSRLLKAKNNHIKLVATPYRYWHEREKLARFHPATLAITTPAKAYQRKAFNGWLQVIVQSNKQAGDIRLTATSDNLRPATLILQSKDQ